jgi:ubiquinone/menaquinone biosynthesis C-methylase UbiE
MESEREGARLEGKTDAAEAERQLRAVGLCDGMCALDVGCGSGAVTRVMARVAAPGRVVGLDASEQRVALAATLAEKAGTAAEFVAGDATRMPFTDGEFDFAWSRFLFEYLPDRRAVLAEMRRVTRFGGVVVVADLDGQLSSFYPLEPDLAAEWEKGLALIRRGGFDPEVGRKLYAGFLAEGLEQLSVTVQQGLRI